MGCPSPRDADDGIRALGPCLELEEAGSSRGRGDRQGKRRVSAIPSP